MPAARPEERGSIRKRLKRIRFLSEALLRRLLSGKGMPDLLSGANGEGGGAGTVPLQDGALCLLPEEVEKLPEPMRMNVQGGRRALSLLSRQHVWRQGRVPRVAVDRVNAASNIFHAGRTRFAAGCGLWFGVQWRRADMSVPDGSGLSYRSALQEMVEALGDEGVGAERSAGYGAFDASWGEAFALREPVPGRPAWLLSRYLPSEAELPHCLNSGEAAYSLERIGGWARSLGGADRRRRQIYLVAEGSLIAWPASAAPARSLTSGPRRRGQRRHTASRVALRTGAGRGPGGASEGGLMTAYTIYDVTASVFTPLHIGSGRELLNEYDYAIRSGRTWRLNEGTLLDAQDVEDAETAALLGRTPPAQLLQEREFRADSPFFRYVVAGAPRSQAAGAQLREQIKDAFDRPYLPGSSLKGALRTALAWNVWRQRGCVRIPAR